MKTTRFLFMVILAMLGVVVSSCERDDNDTNNSDGSPSRDSNYTLTVLPNNSDWGIATGSGTYAANTRVDIEAAPATGYYFIKWSDGAMSNPRTVTVSSDMTLYALFSVTANDPNPYNPADTTGGNNNGGDNGGGDNGGGDNGGGDNGGGDNGGGDNNSNIPQITIVDGSQTINFGYINGVYTTIVDTTLFRIRAAVDEHDGMMTLPYIDILLAKDEENWRIRHLDYGDDSQEIQAVTQSSGGVFTSNWMFYSILDGTRIDYFDATNATMSFTFLVQIYNHYDYYVLGYDPDNDNIRKKTISISASNIRFFSSH